MSQFTRDVQIRFPFDKRNPDPKKSYGVGSLSIWMILGGPKGAVQFAFSTGTYLSHVIDEWRSKGQGLDVGKLFPFDVGYHSPIPMYEGQTSMGACPHLDGKDCYYDGSSLRSEEWLRDALRTDNPAEAIWKMLENEYKERFEN